MSLRVSCDVASVLAGIKSAAAVLQQQVLFSEYEGHEAEALIARGDDIMLIKITAATQTSTSYLRVDRL